MRRTAYLLASLLLVSSCASPKLVSTYDELIDRGVTDFSVQFNAHIKNMGDLAGTPDGTYEKNLKAYNALDAQLDVLIFRASTASEGEGCKLEKNMFERVRALLKDKIPDEIGISDISSSGNPDGCNERLLLLVKNQLTLIRDIHKDVDKCGDNQNISCLRQATAKTALSIANQSINAVSIVEISKKKLGDNYGR